MTTVRLRGVGAGTLLLIALAQTAFAEQVQTVRLMPGTRHETACFIKRGDTPGKTVFIIGGMHGDEAAGYLAARKLKDWSLATGTLVLLPDAHTTAIKAGQRAFPANMNAMFPGNSRGSAMQQTAAQIWALLKQYRPDLLITLHESVGFHREQPHRFGQTLVNDSHTLDGMFSPIIAEVNRHLLDPRDRFSLFVWPYPGCPTYCAYKYLSVPSVTIETCRKLPLEKRIQQQLLLCAIMMSRCGLTWTNGLQWPPQTPPSVPAPPAPQP